MLTIKAWFNMQRLTNRTLFISVFFMGGAIVLLSTYYLSRLYILDKAEQRVRDVMLECRAFHQYVQQVMHPAMYKLKQEGRIPNGFYSPEMLSSSFIVRKHIKSQPKIRVTPATRPRPLKHP